MARTSFYQKNYVGWPPVKIAEFNNPDSYHWENKARDMAHWLELKMGRDDWLAWASRLYRDDTDITWKELFELFEAKFRVIQGEEREAEKHDQDNDPRHYKTNGIY